MKHFIVLLCGMLFGAGMALSSMTNTSKVIGFLDLTGKNLYNRLIATTFLTF